MIKNLSNNNILVNNKKLADTVLKRTKGLMFTRPIKDEGLVFTFPKVMEASLHMFFVFYRIDILWLDENNTISDLRNGAWPFTPLIIPKKKAKVVIELPYGVIKKSETKIGHIIQY